MQPVVPSSTDVTVSFVVLDATTFLPYESLTHATAGLALWYRKGALGSVTALTESTLTNITDAHSDGGLKHADDGIYRLDLPDAAIPTAENEVTVWGGTATGYVILGGAIVGRVVPLAPTTAGRTLDVSAGGEAGVDWANVGSPTTAVNLSATNIDTDQVVASVTGAVGSVTGAVGSVTGAVGSVTGNVGGNVTGSVGSVAAGGITASSIATGAVDADALAADAVAEIQSGLATAAGVSAVETDTQDIQSRLPAALVSGRIDASVGAMAADVVTASAVATGAIDAAALAADAVAEIADGVWDEATAGHATAGTTGKALSDAGAAGDPWEAAVRTLTQPAASVLAAVTGSNITAYSDTTWSIALTGLSSMAARSKIWFIVYEDATAADTEATVLIDSTSGLTRLNGAAYATAAHGALTFPSSTALTITLNATAAAQLSRRSYAYAVKMLDTDGNVSQVSHGGRLTIVQGAPQAIA